MADRCSEGNGAHGCSLWEHLSALHTLCFIYKVYRGEKRKKQQLLTSKEEQRAEVDVLIRGAARKNSYQIMEQIPIPAPTSASGSEEHKEVCSDQTARKR